MNKSLSLISLKVEVLGGSTLREAITEAKELAEKTGVALVDFKFNGTRCYVSENTDVNNEIERYTVTNNPT